jgi:hypothetical protein
MEGELDNARACFRSAQVMDTGTDEQRYAADYALLDYLEGLIDEKLGGDGSDAWARAASNARGVELPEYMSEANALFFIEFGRGPMKYAGGEYGEQLRFRPGSSAAARVRVEVGETTRMVEPWVDLTYQATTRGGRVMDHVLANKAVFKDTTDTAANAALITGAILATQQNRNSAADEVGAGLLIAGAIGKIFAAAANPAADTRQWGNLPEHLSFSSFQLGPGDYPVTVEFVSAGGEPVPGTTRSFTLSVPEGSSDTVVFVSDREQ